MRAAGKATKTEKCLLGLTAAFLCLLAGLYLHDARQTEPVAVETERTVSRGEFLAMTMELAGLPADAVTMTGFSDDAAKLGAPKGFTITVRNLKVSAGAGFLVALTGDIMTMPGLPKVPAAEKIDVDENGKITGLF